MGIAIASILAAAFSSSVASATSPEGSGYRPLYADLLEQYTTATSDIVQTRVDYAGLAREPRWKQLVERLGRVTTASLDTRERKLAFWIDAYNILAIDLVLEHRPVESIRDIGNLFSSVWKKPAGTIGGRLTSLDEIEHEILRPMGEPRIHAAIVCASVSCPPLRREPYDPAALDAQLDDAMRSWLANEQKGAALDRKERELQLSRVFKWFSEDFEAAGGVLTFVLPYLPTADQGWLRSRRSKVRIGYMDYDWGLND